LRHYSLFFPCRHEGHKDYVRAGCVSAVSNDVFASGSYDHTVKVWDARRNEASAILSIDHGSPVEDVALLPNDALLVSAGGHDVKERLLFLSS
jgi:U3 small nucleolar RNA-associated protein 15